MWILSEIAITTNHRRRYSRRGCAVIIMDKFVVPIGLPGLTVVGRKRLFPLRHNLRTFRVNRPGVADGNWYAVGSIRSLEYPYITVKPAENWRLNNASREFVINPVNTPKTSLRVVRANGHSNEIFPVAGLPVINVANPSRQGTPFIAGDEIVPFMRPRESFFQTVVRHSPFSINEIEVVRAVSHSPCLRGIRATGRSNHSRGANSQYGKYKSEADAKYLLQVSAPHIVSIARGSSPSSVTILGGYGARKDPSVIAYCAISFDGELTLNTK